MQVVPLDWWPVSRDCLAYGVTVAILICIIHDERVEWYEALTLVLLYIVYIAVMYWDKSFQKCARFGAKKGELPPDESHVRTGNFQYIRSNNFSQKLTTTTTTTKIYQL